MYKFKKIDTDDVFRQIKELPKKLESFKIAVGNIIADNMQNEVVKRIPNTSGWMSTYRRSINFYYDGKEWAVAGETDGDGIRNYDADGTLLSFTATDPAAKILVAYNDWPLDMVPALNVAYSGAVTIKSASRTQVNVRRKVLASTMPKIRQLLRSAGFDVIAYGVPNINGALTADLKAFSRQLEEGRGDFPFSTIPHWRPASATASENVQLAIAVAKSKFNGILSGEIPSPSKIMPNSIRSIISTYARRKPGV